MPWRGQRKLADTWTGRSISYGKGFSKICGFLHPGVGWPGPGYTARTKSRPTSVALREADP